MHPKCWHLFWHHRQIKKLIQKYYNGKCHNCALFRIWSFKRPRNGRPPKHSCEFWYFQLCSETNSNNENLFSTLHERRRQATLFIRISQIVYSYGTMCRNSYEVCACVCGKNKFCINGWHSLKILHIIAVDWTEWALTPRIHIVTILFRSTNNDKCTFTFVVYIEADTKYFVNCNTETYKHRICVVFFSTQTVWYIEIFRAVLK